MRKSVAFLLVGMVVGAGIALTGPKGQAEEKVKAGESVHVYDDPSFADEHGKVVFSHLEHKEKFGQEKLDCKPCHMTKPPLFAMKKKEGEPRKSATMAEMEQGLSCGGCHNGKTEINGHVAANVADPDGCAHCHKK